MAKKTSDASTELSNDDLDKFVGGYNQSEQLSSSVRKDSGDAHLDYLGKTQKNVAGGAMGDDPAIVDKGE